ncbi:MAG TPA: DNA methyltransferase, partial [Rubrobacteraceae bacterium]|nr:DNA methyltransferase [Rubrobacteraceae bacterium]
MEIDRLYVGDAIEVMRGLPQGSIDLVCADPPYNLGKNYGNTIDKKEHRQYEDFTRDWLQSVDRVLKDNGTIYVFMGVRFISQLYL